MLRMTGIAEEIKVKIIRLSFFGQALNNTSERSEVSIKRTEQRAKSKETKLRVSERKPNLFEFLQRAKAGSTKSKLRVSESRGKIYFYYAEREQVQAHAV